jgi:predicted amidophosphoribosyltransferase
LLLGYVIRDARRRRMNSAVWAVLVLLIPNAIGFIIYFLLRQPLLVKCPQCPAQVHPNFNYCPQCKYNLHPACPKCAHVVQAGDAFCPHCAYELKGLPAAQG